MFARFLLVQAVPHIVTESCPACVKGSHHLCSGEGNCKCAQMNHQTS